MYKVAICYNQLLYVTMLDKKRGIAPTGNYIILFWRLE